MREEYHSAFGRTAKNACIEPYSLCLATLLFIPMPSLTSTISQSKLVLILDNTRFCKNKKNMFWKHDKKINLILVYLGIIFP